MLYFGLVLIGVASLGFLVAIHVTFWRAYYKPDESAVDQVLYARTQDGWRLAMHRYRGNTERASQPVILCHGIGANRYTFDLGPQVSLARFLQRHGWDVWVVELRGVGRSKRMASHSRAHWDWDFSDYLDKDVPTLIDAVWAATGAPAVHWVGHSLGGILMYAHLQGEGALKVRSATAIGSPGFFEPTPILKSTTAALRFAGWLPVFKLTWLTWLFAPFYVGLRVPLILINGANIDGIIVRRAMSHLVTDVCVSVARTIAHWVREQKLTQPDRDYQRGLASIRTPMMLIFGDADAVAPSEEGVRIFDRLGSETRLFHALGQRHGFTEDYGHGDLLFGRHVRTECFPLIENWLATRAKDALPPPMPDTVLDEPVADVVPATLDGDADGADGTLPPVPTLPGPFGLLNRYSPFRRARWKEVREQFRGREAAEREARAKGIDPTASRFALRGRPPRRYPESKR